MGNKDMLKEITDNLAERFKDQPNSLAASPDEVRIAWLLCEVDRLTKVISDAKNCLAWTDVGDTEEVVVNALVILNKD